MTGKEIISLIRAEPATGQRKLFDEYKNYVYAIANNRLSRVASKEDIEECVVDIFADIINELENVDSEIKDLTSYISTIAKRKAIMYYHRLDSDICKLVELDASVSDDSDIAGEFENKERCRKLFDKFKALEEPDSSIILMSYYYSFNSFQIGKRLSMNPATVRKRRQRALKKLKILLSGTGIGEE